MSELHLVADPDDADDTVFVGAEEITGPNLFTGDVGQLTQPVRETFVTLLKRRYIAADRHPADWQIVLDNEASLQSRFNEMFLELVINRDYEVAYKRQALPDNGGKFPTLLYDTEYNREETILLVALRRMIRHGQKAGEDQVFVDRSELVDEVASYRPATATNHVRDEKSANNAVDSLLRNDLLLRTGEADRFRIAPIIEVLLPVERVQDLADWLRGVNGTDTTADTDGDGDVGGEDPVISRPDGDPETAGNPDNEGDRSPGAAGFGGGSEHSDGHDTGAPAGPNTEEIS
jgi:hypothetical protein